MTLLATSRSDEVQALRELAASRGARILDLESEATALRRQVRVSHFLMRQMVDAGEALDPIAEQRIRQNMQEALLGE